MILAKTETLCPTCLKKLEGVIIEEEVIYLKRHCPEHGISSHLISRHPQYYKKLRNYYFSVISNGNKQSRYLLFITNKCNLNCSICFYGETYFKDISLEEIEKIIGRSRSIELVIFGKEPTCNYNLPDIVKLLKKSQNSVSLYTNGIRIGDQDYLSGLRKSGVSKVYLQFDGFKKEIYEELRNCNLFDIKIKALENLRREKIDTVINMTVVKSKNEDQIKVILDYAVLNNFIKTINFTCYIRSGRGRHFFPDNSIMPDELIDIIQKQTNGKISRNSIFLFQKLIYAYMSFFRRRTCFYIQYYWICRTKKGYIPIDQLIDLEGIEKVLDKYKNIMERSGFLARFYILLFLPRYFLNFKSLGLIAEFMFVVCSHAFKIEEYSNMSSRFLQLIFSTACDPYKADFEITKRCHIGIIYKDREGTIQKNNENGAFILDNQRNSDYFKG